jgi:hypothetical protein
VLAWRVGLSGLDIPTGERGEWVVRVDAATGELLDSVRENFTADRPGEEFDIETANNTTSDTCWILPWETSDDEWFDDNGPTGYPGAGSDPFGDGQNAFNFAHDTYHHYFDILGRRSWDNDDAQVEAMVHVGVGFRNASYSRGCDHMQFGDGFVTDDVFAHEFTHGVANHASGLDGSNQPGALNESLADYFAARITGDWIIGEGLPPADAPLRNLEDPPALCHPDHVDPNISGDNNGTCSGPFFGLRPAVRSPRPANDNGSVHTNAGIPNKVATLISDGGTHNGFPINGVGGLKTEHLYYQTLTRRLVVFSDFAHARTAMIATATDFLRRGSHLFVVQDVCDVINAWASVGIGDADSDCDGVPNPPTDDGDGDSIPDGRDNCPLHPNPRQYDTDGDGIGNRCDPDRDGDGVDNLTDNCPNQANNQSDGDRDGIGDACDDEDGDGILERDADGISDPCADGETMDCDDNCPSFFNPGQEDRDGDSIGDACDNDRDGDGFPNETDTCPDLVDPAQLDGDGDTVGDDCDNCEDDPNLDQADQDGDGLGDVCDPDRDGDTVLEDDGDGIYDPCTSGHTLDCDDNCPTDYNRDQLDQDHDGQGLACDDDERLHPGYGEIPIDIFNEDTNRAVRIPVFPCIESTCPDRLPAVQSVLVSVDLSPAYGVRIVDDRGYSVANTSFDPSGQYALHFNVDPEFHYRDGVTGTTFNGRSYTLELMAPPGSPTEDLIGGVISVQLEDPQ